LDVERTAGQSVPPTQAGGESQNGLAGAIQPVAHETRDRVITGFLTVAPILLLGLAAWQVWNNLLHWHDLAVFAIVYIPCTLGITVGFHRLLTHRAFKTSPTLRGVFAGLGSAAIEGPVISWVADHRKHHAFADEEGDPHSPHVGHGEGVSAQFKGFFHAHVGWLFIHTQRGNKQRFAPDLIEDPVVSFVDRTFVYWALASLAVPFALGWLIGGTVGAALTGLLWGGAVRIFVLHHVTYSINSLCHMFGKRDFETTDESRNLAWLALPSMGEAWHNSHHAFPTSAVHGMRRTQLDPSAAVIWTLEKLGLVWGVVRIEPERQAAKAAMNVNGA
jgi:stearoyl-CoA desaturase (delta-9 desaturase)